MKKGQQAEIVNAEFEIIQASIVPAKTDVSGVNLFRPENKEKLIQAFINTEASNYSVLTDEAKKKVKESAKLKIKDKDDKEGFETMQKKYREFVKIRTSTEAERKSIVEPYVKIKNGIDEVGKNILAFFDAEEKRMKAEIDQYKKWEQEELERIEAEAEEKLKNRIKELETVGISFDGSFYSIGESISVDVFTVKEFTDVVFEEFKKRVSAENEKIQESIRIQKLHASRKEELIPYWNFLKEEEKAINYGLLSLDDFDSIIISAGEAKDEFEAEKTRQEEEKTNQANERKALNYEKRSFQLEKEGFEERENGKWFFVTDSGTIQFDKNYLEDSEKAEWDSAFENAKFKKAEYLKASEELSKKRTSDAEAEAERQAEAKKKESRTKSMLSIGFDLVEHGFSSHDHFVGFNIVFDADDEEFSKDLIRWSKEVEEKKAEVEKAIEAERLEKMPEIEKATLWIDTFINAEIPPLKTVEINEIISEFKNKVKLAYEEALSNLKNLA